MRACLASAVLLCAAVSPGAAESGWRMVDPPPTGENLNDIWGSSSNHVFAAGSGGTILQFDGHSWTRTYSTTNRQLRAVWGSGPTDAWAGGEGYMLRVRAPYFRGAIREDEQERMSFTAGELTGEFHHRLSDIVNGLIGEGFQLEGIWESPRPADALSDGECDPGSQGHHDRFIPYGLSTLARLP